MYQQPDYPKHLSHLYSKHCILLSNDFSSARIFSLVFLVPFNLDFFFLQFLLAELNTFYLKFVLWVAPGHWANLVRLILILPWGAVALREVFQFLDDP